MVGVLLYLIYVLNEYTNEAFFIFKTLFIFFFVNIGFLKLFMNKGFAVKNTVTQKNKKITSPKEPKGRLISWSPWPPASFQTRYPAFPLVLTLLILFVGQWYISFLR